MSSSALKHVVAWLNAHYPTAEARRALLTRAAVDASSEQAFTISILNELSAHAVGALSAAASADHPDDALALAWAGGPASFGLRFEVSERLTAVPSAGVPLEVESPLADGALLALWAAATEGVGRAFELQGDGSLRPEAKDAAGGLLDRAAELGELLATFLGEALVAAIVVATERQTARATLTIEAPVGPEGEALLALPWELLCVAGAMPVRAGRLSILRAHGGLGEAPPPRRPLSIVASVAAPVEANLDAEAASEALWRILVEHEHRLFINDVGTLEATQLSALDYGAPVAHLIAGGSEEGLALEGDGGFERLMPGEAVASALRDANPDLRLVVLELPQKGWGAGRAPIRRMAAQLHSGGVDVVAFSGPADPQVRGPALRAFYDALADGVDLLAAVQASRQRLAAPPKKGSNRVYPLAWSAVAVYSSRGGAAPVTLTDGRAGEIAPAAWEETEAPFVPSGTVVEGMPLPPWGFVGRRDVLAEGARRWSRGDRLLIVHGPQGVGKTSLCVRMAPALASIQAGGGRSVPVIALHARQVAQSKRPIVALWRQLQSQRYGDAWDGVLAEYQREGLTAEAVIELVLQLNREGGGLLLYVDGADALQTSVADDGFGRWSDAEVGQIFEGLMGEAAQGKGLSLLISTHLPMESFDDGAHLPLGAMGLLQQVRLLRRFSPLDRCSAPALTRLAAQLDGLPATAVLAGAIAGLSLGRSDAPYDEAALVGAVVGAERQGFGYDALFERLWGLLGDDVRSHLGRATLLTEPTPWEALATLKTSGGTGGILARAGLVLPCLVLEGQPTEWLMPQVVANAVTPRTQEDLRQTHAALGDWYAGRFEVDPQPMWDLYAVHHLCAAGLGALSWPAARRLAILYRHARRFQEGAAVVEEVLASRLKGPDRGVALVFAAQLARLGGLPRPDAVDELREAVRLCPASERSFALDELGQHHADRGEFDEAVNVLEQSVAIERADKGDLHPDVAASLTALAKVMQARGDLDRAQQTLEQVVDIRRKGEEGGGAHLAQDLHELARLLGAKGDMDAARERLEESIVIKQRLLGQDAQQEITRSLHELAGMDMAMGQLEAAKEKVQRAVSLEIEASGTENHPSVIAALKEASRIYQAMGDLPGAMALLERALSAELSIYGDEPNGNVADTHVQLAGLHSNAGKAAEARSGLEEALRIRAAIGAEVEPSERAAVLLSLAAVLQAQGDLAACRGRLEEALAIQRVIFDVPHADEISVTLNLLAGTAKALGDSAAAEAGFAELVENREAQHGSREHVDVAVAEANLAQIYMETGREAAAQPLLKHAYDVFLEQAGPTHPITQQLARIVPGADTSQLEKNPALPFALKAFSALAGAPVKVSRLGRIAWRIMLRTNAGPFLPMLLMADIESLTPGSLAEDPSSVPPPPRAPRAVQTMWSGLVMELAQAHMRFKYDFDHLVAALPKDADGHVAPPLGMELPEADLNSQASIVDETRAELVGAERRGKWPEAIPEVAVWARAAEISLIHEEAEDGAEIAKRVMGAVPEFKAALLERWRPHMSEAHRKALGLVATPGQNH